MDITNDLLFFRDRERFVWTSEKSGYRRAYLYDYERNEIQLTDGDWEISTLTGLDESAGWLYFYAKKDSFIDQHVYRVKLDGSNIERLTNKSGWYEWQFSPDHQMVIETWSDANTPHSMNFADKLQGNLLLIHGTGDENVKYAFTLQLADALIAHNKQFDMMIYPNQHHNLDDVQLHVFTRITNYFLEKL